MAIPIPLIIAGIELIKTRFTGDKEKDEAVVTKVMTQAVKMAEKAPWKSTRNLGGWITIILLMFNRKIGLDLSIEEVYSIAGLMGLLIGAKTIKG